MDQKHTENFWIGPKWISRGGPRHVTQFYSGRLTRRSKSLHRRSLVGREPRQWLPCIQRILSATRPTQMKLSLFSSSAHLCNRRPSEAQRVKDSAMDEASRLELQQPAWTLMQAIVYGSITPIGITPNGVMSRSSRPVCSRMSAVCCRNETN